MDTVTIERLGHLGDGIARDRYIPFTLPGEVVELTDKTARVVTPAEARISPVCAHFGTCGGCALQHASDPFLADWKTDVVRRALDAHGLDAPFRPTITSPPHSRRRAVFTGRRTKKTVQIGFYARGSDQVVDITECHVLLPQIMAIWPALEAIVRGSASRKGALRLAVTWSGNGADVTVSGGRPLDTQLAATLAQLAEAHDLARLAWDDEPVALCRTPHQSFAGHLVVPPPGAFLQATDVGQVALIAGVREAVGDATKVIDLFSGCGTFTLPLAEQADVHAVEGIPAMLDALSAGWRQANGLRKVTTEMRDLFSRPVRHDELKRFEAVVIDPPRAGALSQMEDIAASNVSRVAAVSCNPVTFARDAQVLTTAGFTLDWVQVVDQFRWSPHVELVTCFSR